MNLREELEKLIEKSNAEIGRGINVKYNTGHIHGLKNALQFLNQSEPPLKTEEEWVSSFAERMRKAIDIDENELGWVQHNNICNIASMECFEIMKQLIFQLEQKTL